MRMNNSKLSRLKHDASILHEHTFTQLIAPLIALLSESYASYLRYGWLTNIK